MSTIAPIKPIEIPTAASIDQKPAPGDDLGASFKSVLDDAHHYQNASTAATEQFASGDPAMGIHEVMIATEKANIAVRYATTLKNKVVEAYRDLMNTQV